jgi:peptidoglycan/LPS O-acetylase OafA/YrhL
MKLREIERLRAIAILMVLVVHWDAPRKMLPGLLYAPWSGVDLFFVISGYVVSLSLMRLLPAIDAVPTFVDAFHASKQALKTFYTRRFFRIMPPALAVMVFSRVMAGVFPQQFGTTREWWEEFFAFFGGLYNYVYPFHYHSFRNGLYWSLAVEEHFYLILPILFVAFRTTNRRLLACAAVAFFSIACRALPKPDVAIESLDAFEKFSSHLRFDSLMAGVAIALVADKVKGKPIMPPWAMRVVILPLVIAIVACLPGAAPAYVMQREGFIALWILSGVLVAYAGMDRGYVLPIPGIARALEYVGSRSFALYLLHVPVVRIEECERAIWHSYANLVPQDVAFPWRRAIVLLVASEILYRLVEKPFIRIGRKLIDAPDGPPAPSRRFLVLAGAGILAFGLVYFRHDLMLALGPPNLARGRAVYMSSRADGKPDGSVLTNGQLENEFGAHTKDEDNPWVMIDLGHKTRIGAIRVYNRDDGWQDQAIPLDIEISDDDKVYTSIAHRDQMFTQEYPWRVRCTESQPRFVRLRAPRHTTLCLTEVEIFASTAMAVIP